MLAGPPGDREGDHDAGADEEQRAGLGVHVGLLQSSTTQGYVRSSVQCTV